MTVNKNTFLKLILFHSLLQLPCPQFPSQISGFMFFLLANPAFCPFHSFFFVLKNKAFCYELHQLFLPVNFADIFSPSLFLFLSGRKSILPLSTCILCPTYTFFSPTYTFWNFPIRYPFAQCFLTSPFSLSISS